MMQDILAEKLGFHPTSPEYMQDPAPVLHKLHENCPVFFYPPFNSWVITRYDDIKAAMLDYKTFSSRGAGLLPAPEDLAPYVMDFNVRENLTLPLMDPPDHTIQRNLTARGLAAGIIQRLEQTIRTRAIRLIDDIYERGEADILNDFAYPLTLGMICDLMALPDEHKHSYRAWTEAFFALLRPMKSTDETAHDFLNLPEEVTRRYWQDLADANSLFRTLVTKRKTEKSDDMFSAIVAMMAGGGEEKVTDGDFVRHMLSFVAAGHDTTGNAIAHLVYYMTMFPDQKAAMLADPSLVPNAVDEGLRIRGSARGAMRITTTEVQVRGVTIPADEFVFLALVGASHDEEYFPDSNRFDIFRKSKASAFPFGLGKHTCLGSALAKLECRIALEELYRRMPDIAVVPGHQLSYKPIYGLTVLDDLPVRWSVQ